MTRPTSIALHDDAREQVIDHLYDVALDPARYEEMLDHWEGLVAPLRRDVDGKGFQLNDDSIEAHFDRASLFLDRWEREHRDTGNKNLLDGFDRTAAVLIDANLAIVAANDGAKQSLGVSQTATIADLPLDKPDLEHLEREARLMLNGARSGRGMFQFRSAEDNRFVIFHLMKKELHPGKPMLIAITSDVFWPNGFNDLLKGSFGFTNAEADVARGLVECCSIKEIAETRNRSSETVRAQVKSVLAKTETRSQAEAVRLLLSMMDIASFTFDRAADVSRSEDQFNHLTDVPFQTIHVDGRRLDFLVLGDPNGRAVMYFPGDYGLIRWPASAERAALERGIRIISPVRAGYGLSSAPAKGANYTKTVCNDLAAVLDACGVDSCPAVSQGSDSFIAFKMDEFHPGRMSALIACSGVLPLTRPEQFDRMEKWHRFINASARYTPHLTPFMVKAGFFLARRIGKRGFIHAAYGNTPADVETFEHPETYEAIVAGSDVALSAEHSSHRSFTANVLDMEREDWTHAVLALKDRVPVTFLNGLQDPQVPESTLHEHMIDHPWIRFETFEDSGQLLLFRHWRAVLDLLEKKLPSRG